MSNLIDRVQALLTPDNIEVTMNKVQNGEALDDIDKEALITALDLLLYGCPSESAVEDFVPN